MLVPELESRRNGQAGARTFNRTGARTIDISKSANEKSRRRSCAHCSKCQAPFPMPPALMRSQHKLETFLALKHPTPIGRESPMVKHSALGKLVAESNGCVVVEGNQYFSG